MSRLFVVLASGPCASLCENGTAEALILVFGAYVCPNILTTLRGLRWRCVTIHVSDETVLTKPSLSTVKTGS